MILDSLDVDVASFEGRTGWAIKPEGACKAEMCVPMPAGAGDVPTTIDARVLAERLGMPLVEDAEHGLWALGPETLGRALASADAPDFELPDRHGVPFQLSSLRGLKVLLLAWASW
jgi:hypothetical protein